MPDTGTGSLIDALVQAYQMQRQHGSQGAFLQEDAQRRSGGGDALTDRALEGNMIGNTLPLGMGVPAAAAAGLGYEGIAKPLAENVPAINSLLAGTPFEHVPGQSAPSVVNDPAGAAKRLLALITGAAYGSVPGTAR